MDLGETEAEASFRADLRAWLAGVLPGIAPPPHHADWPARRAYDTAWQRQLFDAGYAGINWPAEHGGRGSTPTEQLIFLEETERARAPYVGCNFVGTLHAGPTLIAEATPAQHARHLPGILKGEQIWCQGFSEPGAGSDLASLRTRATRDGDDYVINGQKIWTSMAQVADYCELLVRTDQEAPKHQGITWLIVPMDTVGIEVRPLTAINGSNEFSEVFFDDVRVPIANRVGAENDGWRVAMVTFSFERGTAFVGELLASIELVRDLAGIARRVPRKEALPRDTVPRNGATAWDDAGVRRDLGRVAAELDALWALTRRNVSQATRTGVSGPGGSVFKLAYHDTRDRLGELARRILDRAGLGFDDPCGLGRADHVQQQVYALSLGIAAGTTQIQRDIVAERLLGLPKEHRWTSS